MDKVTHSPAQLKNQSSMSEQEVLTKLGLGLSVSSAKRSDLIRFYGLRNYILSVLARRRYIFKLWLLREVKIRRCLIDNFDQISDPHSRRIAKFYGSTRIGSRLIALLEKWSLRGVIANSFQNQNITNS